MTVKLLQCRWNVHGRLIEHMLFFHFDGITMYKNGQYLVNKKHFNLTRHVVSETFKKSCPYCAVLFIRKSCDHRLAHQYRLLAVYLLLARLSIAPCNYLWKSPRWPWQERIVNTGNCRALPQTALRALIKILTRGGHSLVTRYTRSPALRRHSLGCRRTAPYKLINSWTRGSPGGGGWEAGWMGWATEDCEGGTRHEEALNKRMRYLSFWTPVVLPQSPWPGV